MAGKKDIPRVRNPPSGDGHHVTYRFMNTTELAEREARHSLLATPTIGLGAAIGATGAALMTGMVSSLWTPSLGDQREG